MRADRTVLFIHGFGGAAGIWALQAAHFQKSVSVLAVDLPGHGDRAWHGENLDAMAADIGRVLDGAPAKKDVALVASSFGGLVGLELWRQRPGVFTSMTFVGAVPRFTATHDFPAGLTPERIDKLSAQLKGNTAAVLEMFFRSLFTRAERESEGYARVKGLLKGLPVPSVATLDALLAILKTHDHRATLKAVDVPVRFVLGGQDPICPMAVIACLREMLPSVRIDVMKGCGHFPFLSRPDEFNGCVEDLLR